MALIETKYFGIARKIVSNMTMESWNDIPHGALSYKPEVTEFMKECKKLNEGVTDKSKKITINTVMLKVICEGLKAAPKLNSHLVFNKKLVRGTLKTYDNIDISMPIILPNGEMMTVNMHDMGNKSLTEMTEAIADKIRRANNTNIEEVMYQVSLNYTLEGLARGEIMPALRRLYGSKMPGKHKVTNLSGKAKKDYYSIPEADRLTRHDIDQGTTTISNLGSVYRQYRGECTLLEIIPPQVSTFAVNAVQKTPVVVTNEKGEDEIKVGMIMPITVAIDHKALDYGDIVPFFQKLDEIFANPSVIQDWK